MRDALESRTDDLRKDALSKLTRVIEPELSATTATIWREAAQRAFSKETERIFENGRDLLANEFSKQTKTPFLAANTASIVSSIAYAVQQPRSLRSPSLKRLSMMSFNSAKIPTG